MNTIIQNTDSMNEKKPDLLKSPDVSKLKEVIIDHRTKIYINSTSDPEEAKNRYLYRNSYKRIK